VDLPERAQVRILDASAGGTRWTDEAADRSSGLKLDPASGSEVLPLTARLERSLCSEIGELDADVRALLLVAALE